MSCLKTTLFEDDLQAETENELNLTQRQFNNDFLGVPEYNI